MKILYLHGWQSVPGGVKPSHLQTLGHELIEPALPHDDFEAALDIAQAALERHRPALIVGSSRGGALALNLRAGEIPLVLLCPAWKRWGAARTAKPGTVILHAVADEVIPYADSLELLANSGLSPETALITVGHEHRLADEESLAALAAAVDR